MSNIFWRAGYDTNINAWAISRDGTNLQSWYPGSNVLSGPVVIGGVARETWPTEFDGTALSNAVAGVGLVATNVGAQGSNYADSVGAAVGLVATNLAAGAGLVGTNAQAYAEGVGVVASNALPKAGGTMTGTLAMGTNALVFKDVANATNLIIMHSGLLNGTNGIYFAAPNGSNYWILFK